MMDDEALTLIAIVLIVVGILFLPVVAGRTQCRAKAVKQELQFDYGIAQGCMVKHNGKWVDYDRLRYTEE
jgi:hypothetical protein